MPKEVYNIARKKARELLKIHVSLMEIMDITRLSEKDILEEEKKIKYKYYIDS
ncbi:MULTISPECIES: hypothetical protein [unclassified Clostridium]|uniref:hypothetical protein n=1 Tax=unclassified Clostridium TaxID=2614128 RepID=UPI0025BF933D|nr:MULTISPECIES: hypothetical protein [unclassified Clostridium]